MIWLISSCIWSVLQIAYIDLCHFGILIYKYGLQELPSGHTYDYCARKSTPAEHKLVFKVVDVTTEQGILEWLHQFEQATKTTWRVRGKKQKPCDYMYTIYRVKPRNCVILIFMLVT